jgi:hypothetical protein
MQERIPVPTTTPRSFLITDDVAKETKANVWSKLHENLQSGIPRTHQSKTYHCISAWLSCTHQYVILITAWVSGIPYTNKPLIVTTDCECLVFPTLTNLWLLLVNMSVWYSSQLQICDDHATLNRYNSAVYRRHARSGTTTDTNAAYSNKLDPQCSDYLKCSSEITLIHPTINITTTLNYVQTVGRAYTNLIRFVSFD